MKFYRLIIPLLIFLLIPKTIFAQSCSDSANCDNFSSDQSDQRMSCITNLISQCQQLLNQGQTQENTLKSQLNLIDGQSTVTQLKIQETTLKIDQLQRQVSDLSSRIDRIRGTLDSLSEILLNRIVQTYKYNNLTSAFNLLLSSSGFSDLIERLKYIQVAQAYDKQKLYELQATKLSYNEQKQDKQTRQTEAEKLNKDLQTYQQQLDDQKKAKGDLLRETQNSEVKYQQLITKLKADAESLGRALSGGGLKLGAVKKGDIIASVGNSGCSTGPHLHMEVITDAHIAQINNKNYIVDNGNQPINWDLDHRVDPRPYIQSGQFPKPVNEYTDDDSCSNNGACHNGDISTRFKQTYFLGVHTGLDIIDYYGAPIHAAADGDSYAFSDSQACSYTGTVGKGVALDHHNGIVTLYWHIP